MPCCDLVGASLNLANLATFLANPVRRQVDVKADGMTVMTEGKSRSERSWENDEWLFLSGWKEEKHIALFASPQGELDAPLFLHAQQE